MIKRKMMFLFLSIVVTLMGSRVGFCDQLDDEVDMIFGGMFQRSPDIIQTELQATTDKIVTEIKNYIDRVKKLDENKDMYEQELTRKMLFFGVLNSSDNMFGVFGDITDINSEESRALFVSIVGDAYEDAFSRLCSDLEDIFQNVAKADAYILPYLVSYLGTKDVLASMISRSGLNEKDNVELINKLEIKRGLGARDEDKNLDNTTTFFDEFIRPYIMSAILRVGHDRMPGKDRVEKYLPLIKGRYEDPEQRAIAFNDLYSLGEGPGFDRFLRNILKRLKASSHEFSVYEVADAFESDEWYNSYYRYIPLLTVQYLLQDLEKDEAIKALKDIDRVLPEFFKDYLPIWIEKTKTNLCYSLFTKEN